MSDSVNKVPKSPSATSMAQNPGLHGLDNRLRIPRRSGPAQYRVPAVNRDRTDPLYADKVTSMLPSLYRRLTDLCNAVYWESLSSGEHQIKVHFLLPLKGRNSPSVHSTLWCCVRPSHRKSCQARQNPGQGPLRSHPPRRVASCEDRPSWGVDR